MTKLSCLLGLHEWWHSRPEEADFVYFNVYVPDPSSWDGIINARERILVQQRRCLHCGKVEYKKVKRVHTN